MSEPKNLLEAMIDINRLTQERDALYTENIGLHQWADKDRLTIANYLKECARLRAEIEKLTATKSSVV